MSTLGQIHTVISILAIVMVAVALIKDKFILPYTQSGKIYSLLTLLTCVTSFWLSKHGGFNPGHAIGILVLILLGVAYGLVKTKEPVNTKKFRIQSALMTGTLFLSLLPAINETLTRLPVNHPVAQNAESPVIKLSSGILFLIFSVGLFYQRRYIKNL